MYFFLWQQPCLAFVRRFFQLALYLSITTQTTTRRTAMPTPKPKAATRRPLSKPNPLPDPDIRLRWAKNLMSLPDDFFDDDLKRGGGKRGNNPKRGK